MARQIRLSGGQRAIAAESEDEGQLVAGAGPARRVVLEESYYQVDPALRMVLLPAGASEATAERVRRAFEAAAIRDAEARARRGSFGLADG
jgi:hypothetical protein